MLVEEIKLFCCLGNARDVSAGVKGCAISARVSSDPSVALVRRRYPAVGVVTMQGEERVGIYAASLRRE